VGTAAAVIGLGFLIRGRESGADHALGSVRSLGASNASYPLVQLSEYELSRIGYGVGAGISADSGATPSDSAPLPVFRRPKVPLLGDAQLVSDTEVPSTLVEDAAVDLPAPLRPTRPSVAEAPYDVGPQIRNANQVRQALEREYPIGLREVGIGGRVEMSFFIDAHGVVERFEVKESSGNQALDQAALRVAQVFQFIPARRRNETVPAGLTLGITFESGNGGALASAGPSSASVQGAAQATPREIDEPAVMPFDVAPQVRNANQVRQALAREYPIGLRDAGIGGRVEMSFYVNAQGVVEQFQVKQSSGNASLDRAALRVAQVFQFTPALLAAKPVAAWISLGITFEGK
jgi:TonB family protein